MHLMPDMTHMYVMRLYRSANEQNFEVKCKRCGNTSIPIQCSYDPMRATDFKVLVNGDLGAFVYVVKCKECNLVNEYIVKDPMIKQPRKAYIGMDLEVLDRQEALERIFVLAQEAMEMKKPKMKKALDEILDWSYEFIDISKE